MIVFDSINTLLVIVLLFNVALLMPILRNAKHNIQTTMYAVNIVTILLWVIAMVGYRSQNDQFLLWLRALYVIAIFIGVTYMQFTFYYPIKIKYAEYYIYAINILAFTTAGIVAFTDKIIINGIKNSGAEPGIIFGSWYLLYISIIIIPFVLGFSRHLYVIIKHTSTVLYLLLGYLFSANVAFATNLVLPWLGIFALNWVGQFFTVVMVLFTTYSIIRFNLMNIKFVAINAGVILLAIVTLSQVLFADTPRSLLVSSIVFLVSSLTGYYLVVLSKNERLSLDNTMLLNKKIKKINNDLKDANEKLKSLDKLKSEFISLASHQLRSPLTVIKGYASTLTDGVVGDLTPKQNEIVHHIYSAAHGLANVVEDFLNVTKIEQGGMQYAFVSTDIRAIVNDIASDMKIAAEDRHLTLLTAIDVEGSYVTMADGVKMKQVFLNLVDNSIKYTKEGFVKISLSNNIKKKTITFSVSDSGMGVTKETKEKLFKKFSRGEGKSVNGGGSGLGLYLAQEIVTAHKGVINVDSEGEGKGSTFSVEFPIA
jgi:signal transduction histidine kinase